MFAVAVAIVALSLLYLLIIVAKSRRPMPVPRMGARDTHYVIVVPCLDEELVIGNTLRSLSRLPADRVRIVVVDDDSDDATAPIVQSFAPRVELLQRRRPNAQVGKGDSLNLAYQYILSTSDQPADKVVIGVVDADGRLDPEVIDVLDRHFSEPDVGGLQLAVSINNRKDGLLPRMQDFEFMGFAPILLTAREHFGSVALGGNGQFARLSELMRLGPAPWKNCLTEDLDLGVRLALGGSRIRFTSEAQIHQQGLANLRKLLRQRTRWVQGHFECWSLIPEVYRSRIPSKAFLDFLYVLISPGIMFLSSIIFAIAPALLGWTLATGVFTWNEPRLWIFLSAIYLLMFGPPIFYGAAYARHREDVSKIHAFALAHVVPLYTYVWYIAVWRALFRMVLRRNSWAKTDRHVELSPPTPVGAVREEGASR
ncbi:MAG TPA: glycosyltransferase family 2 protein [Jiangellaceae bacterium]|nr:glycosyltransferase family 2 protein [Jiangellaceae bacterium]